MIPALTGVHSVRWYTTTKVLEIENGNTRSRVFGGLLVKEMLAHLMGEARRKFGHPAVM